MLIRFFLGEGRAQDWFDVIMVAMGTHCDNPPLLIAACEGLSIMAEYHPEYMVLIDDLDGHTPLHNAVMAALALHFDNADLCQSACKAIASCAMHSQIIQKVLTVNICRTVSISQSINQ